MGFVSLMFFNIIVLIFVALVFVAAVSVTVAIIILIVRRIKINNGKQVGGASKVAAIVLFVVGIISLLPIAFVFLLGINNRLHHEKEYRGLKNTILIEDRGSELVIDGKKLVEAENLGLQNEKSESAKKVEVANLITTLNPKAYYDFDYITVYKVENDSGYNFYLIGSDIYVAEDEESKIYDYYVNEAKIIPEVYVINSGTSGYRECEFDIKRLVKIRKYYDDENRKKEFEWLKYEQYDFSLCSDDGFYYNHINVVNIDNRLYLSSIWSDGKVTVYEMDKDDEEYVRRQIKKVKERE